MNFAKKIITSIVLGIPFACFANNDSANLKVDIGVVNQELQDIYRFEGIESYKITLTGKLIKGKKVNLYYREYINGKASKLNILTQGIPDKYYSAADNDSAFVFRFLSKHYEKDSLAKFMFRYPRTGINTDFKTLYAGYSLRAINASTEQKGVNITLQQKLPLFSYSLPYTMENMPGSSFYCELTSEGVSPELWWEKYHIKHYIVFYIEIV